MKEYYNKPINLEHYTTLEIMGNPGNRTNKFLSKEEFLSGKNGLIWMDNTTKELVFSDERNSKTHTVDIAQ